MAKGDYRFSRRQWEEQLKRARQIWRINSLLKIDDSYIPFRFIIFSQVVPDPCPVVQPAGADYWEPDGEAVHHQRRRVQHPPAQPERHNLSIS